jgi:hypothetical protein
MPFEKLTSDRLSTLLGEVLDNGVYRENARRLQDIIAKTNGLSMAADIVERSFGVTKKAGERRFVRLVMREINRRTCPVILASAVDGTRITKASQILTVGFRRNRVRN